MKMVTSGLFQKEESEHRGLAMRKVFSALFYASASFMITVINKTVLTTYSFPSYQFLGLGQMIATVIVLWCARYLHIVQFPHLEKNIICKIWPLPIIYLGNMTTGLGGTKELSLPMFTALRRFSILMTMIGEYIILGIQASMPVQLSVLGMIGGALLAAADDVTFSIVGYILVLLNDAFTAANGVYMKKKLDNKELGKYGLMFYNALFMLVPATILAWIMGDLQSSFAFEHWGDILFLIQFISSCIMGFVLSYSIILCTYYNSALTTTIIGCLKNILVTYLGMIIGGDYIFSLLNFIGLNISIVASLFYTYITFKRNPNTSYVPIKVSNSKIDVI